MIKLTKRIDYFPWEKEFWLNEHLIRVVSTDHRGVTVITLTDGSEVECVESPADVIKLV